MQHHNTSTQDTASVHCERMRVVLLTIFGEEVDDGVCLAVPVQVCQLRAAVYCHVMDAKSSLAVAACVQNRTLTTKNIQKTLT